MMTQFAVGKCCFPTFQVNFHHQQSSTSVVMFAGCYVDAIVRAIVVPVDEVLLAKNAVLA